MLYCGALERSNIYRTDCGTLCFYESERDLRYVGLSGKEILKKVEAAKKSIHERKAELVYLCVRKKTALKLL